MPHRTLKGEINIRVIKFCFQTDIMTSASYNAGLGCWHTSLCLPLSCPFNFWTSWKRWASLEKGLVAVAVEVSPAEKTTSQRVAILQLLLNGNKMLTEKVTFEGSFLGLNSDCSGCGEHNGQEKKSWGEHLSSLTTTDSLGKNCLLASVITSLPRSLPPHSHTGTRQGPACRQPPQGVPLLMILGPSQFASAPISSLSATSLAQVSAEAQQRSIS